LTQWLSRRQTRSGVQLEAPSFLMPLDKSRAYGGDPMTARGSSAA